MIRLAHLTRLAAGGFMPALLAPVKGAAAVAEPVNATRYIAIDNVCAWPQLTVLRDGTIAAIIFNKPSHGQMEGDAECWASANGGFAESRRRSRTQGHARISQTHVRAQAINATPRKTACSVQPTVETHQRVCHHSGYETGSTSCSPDGLPSRRGQTEHRDVPLS